MEKLLTVKEAAGILRCHTNTAYELVRRSEIHAVRLRGRGGKAGRGGAIRIPESALRRFLGEGATYEDG